MTPPSIAQIKYVKILWRQREETDPKSPKKGKGHTSIYTNWLFARNERLASVINKLHRNPSLELRANILRCLQWEVVSPDSGIDRDIFTYLISELKQPKNNV
jgi:hypothetical protein